MVSPNGRFACAVLFASMLAACNSASSGSPAASGPNDGDAGTEQGDSATGEGVGAQDASSGQDATMGAHGGVNADGGAQGGGADSGADGGIRDVGSCCVAQTTPGCSNPSLEVCVCEKDQTCCTTAWSLACVYLVQQKYCQPGVRDCVCGADAGQWDQTSCCTSDWASSCDSVATLKCGAVQGCF